MVVDISDPSDPDLVGEPFDKKAGESTRELRVWRSQDVLIVLNTNCGVGPTLHQCTQTSISNIRFYDISGRKAKRPQLLNEFKVDTARVLPVGGPERPRARADLRRQRNLVMRRPRRRAELPVLGLGHLARARRRGAGDALQRHLSL